MYDLITLRVDVYIKNDNYHFGNALLDKDLDWQRPQGPYSQNFIFFVTYGQAQYIGMFTTGKPLQLSVM